MANNSFNASVAGLRSVRQSLRTSQTLCRHNVGRRRQLHCSRVLREEGRSFRGQLYDSTFKRLERERAEQQRLAQERAEPASLAGQLRWASGMVLFPHSFSSTAELTVSSNHDSSGRRLLDGDRSSR